MADSCERYANNVHPGWNFLLTAFDTDNFRLLFLNNFTYRMSVLLHVYRTVREVFTELKRFGQ